MGGRAGQAGPRPRSVSVPARPSSSPADQGQVSTADEGIGLPCTAVTAGPGGDAPSRHCVILFF